MIIYTLWHAGEYTVDNNCEFPPDYAKKRADPAHREMLVEVHESTVRALFEAPKAKGAVRQLRYSDIGRVLEWANAEHATTNGWSAADIELVQRLRRMLPPAVAEPSLAPYANVVVSTGAHCDACGHDHAGRSVGFICIGCPCDQRPGASPGPTLT